MTSLTKGFYKSDNPKERSKLFGVDVTAVQRLLAAVRGTPVHCPPSLSGVSRGAIHHFGWRAEFAFRKHEAIPGRGSGAHSRQAVAALLLGRSAVTTAAAVDADP
jgi:hypothetical protein